MTDPPGGGFSFFGVADGSMDFNWVAGAFYTDCNDDPGVAKSLGGLILEVPTDAFGTYEIALDPNPNFTFMQEFSLAHFPGTLALIPACITIIEPPIRAPAPHDILKNRYISIDPRGASGDNPPSHHIRVMVDSSLVNGLTGSGPWWANAPQSSDEADCLSVVTTTKPAAEPDWSACPTVHLTGCPIVPTTTYAIATEVGGNLSADALLDTQAKPGVNWYGDCVGFLSSSGWTPPDGTTSIDDALACIKTFQDPNAFNATHVSVTDLRPADGTRINFVVGYGDVLQAILGFKGHEYPEPDLTRCP